MKRQDEVDPNATVSSAALRMRRWRLSGKGKDVRKRVDTRKGDRHKKRLVWQSSRLPFRGIDGEGAGVDDRGRQLYLLMCAGDDECFSGAPLSTRDCLSFILRQPRDCILVGFSFGYDATMILRDLPDERRAWLLKPKDMTKGFSSWTYWNEFGIEYLPKQYLKVCLTEPGLDGKRRVVKGSSRTIYETFGFFQGSFLKTIKNFSVCDDDQLALIERKKAERGSFDVQLSAEDREYCRLECALLAAVMEKLRTSCEAANIYPRTWNGAGKLAKALHTSYETPKRKELDHIPHDVWMSANYAYYGGRFEVSRIGPISGPVYEYDINSAYPAAMLDLPCLVHGGWEAFEGKPADLSGTYVAKVRFDHAGVKDFRYGGLPIRSKQGLIFWPGEGNGTYWSCEIRAAGRLGCSVHHVSGWRYVRRCDCNPFDWVGPLYLRRKLLGKSTEGYPIKLATNSLYGTLAQRIGNPVWGNHIWASLITAMTRAKLCEAVAQKPDAVVMMATDGIYSTAPLELPIGGDLGQWEAAVHDHMFIVQPGLYWGPPKPKTRGVPLKFFEDRTDAFEACWAAYAERQQSALAAPEEAPVCAIQMTSFIGIKLAQARGKPETAGKWIEHERSISFDWTRKRRPGVIWQDGSAVTFPLPGHRDLTSIYYASVSPDVLDALDAGREEIDEQPDRLDMTVPWKDD